MSSTYVFFIRGILFVERGEKNFLHTVSPFCEKVKPERKKNAKKTAENAGNGQTRREMNMCSLNGKLRSISVCLEFDEEGKPIKNNFFYASNFLELISIEDMEKIQREIEKTQKANWTERT